MRAACCEATVLRNEVIAPDIRLLTVVWPDRDHAPHAGQFFTLRAWGADEAPFLSRPISVHRWNPDSSTIEFLYQVVGEGTEKIAQLKMKDTFQLTGPMGNGFDVPDILSKYKKIAVVGGGIGTAPLLLLCKQLCRAGVRPDVYVGFRDTSYGMDRFVPWCHDVFVATDSGNEGHHGLVTDLLDAKNYDIVLTLVSPTDLLKTRTFTFTLNPVPVQPKWKLDWEDEFDKGVLDETSWSVVQRANTTALRYMSSDPRCYEFRDGCIVMKAIVNAHTGRIIGCTLFCIDAPEVINLVSLAMKNDLHYSILRDFIFTHPSMSEGLNELFDI